MHYECGIVTILFCPSVSVSSKFWADHATKGLNTSGHHSNNDNSENLVHGVPEGG